MKAEEIIRGFNEIDRDYETNFSEIDPESFINVAFCHCGSEYCSECHGSVDAEQVVELPDGSSITILNPGQIFYPGYILLRN